MLTTTDTVREETARRPGRAPAAASGAACDETEATAGSAHARAHTARARASRNQSAGSANRDPLAPGEHRGSPLLDGRRHGAVGFVHSEPLELPVAVALLHPTVDVARSGRGGVPRGPAGGLRTLAEAGPGDHDPHPRVAGGGSRPGRRGLRAGGFALDRHVDATDPAFRDRQVGSRVLRGRRARPPVRRRAAGSTSRLPCWQLSAHWYC